MFFFLSGTGTISLKREGEDSRIVTRLGEGSKVYSTMRLQNDWIVFTEDGSYVFNLRTHQVTGYGTEYSKRTSSD